MDKIRQLPGTRMSPRTLLHQVLERGDELQAVAVVVFERDGSMWSEWSNMKSSDLAAAAVIMHADANEALQGTFNFEPRSGEDDSGA